MVEGVKRGRPPKPENDRKNTYLGFRVRDGMREKLEAAAVAGGRSPSEEIERRLVASFEAETLMAVLPRLIAEGIAADREAQRAAVTTRAQPFVSGSQHGLAMSTRTRPADWFNKL